MSTETCNGGSSVAGGTQSTTSIGAEGGKAPQQRYLMTDSNNSTASSSNEINAITHPNSCPMNSVTRTGGSNGRKSDYVDFNQFMAQHNFLGHNNNKNNNNNGSASSAQLINSNGCVASEFTPSSNSIASNSTNGSELFYQQQMAANNFNQDYLTGSGAYFDYNAAAAPMPTPMLAITNFLQYNNGSYNNSFSSNSASDYSPFGTDPGSGLSTSYLANPFAAGFDLSTEVAMSQLQASAPEFVPRFSNLKISESLENGQLENGSCASGANAMPPAKSSRNDVSKYSTQETSEKKNGTEASYVENRTTGRSGDAGSENKKKDQAISEKVSARKTEPSESSESKANRDFPVALETFSRGSNYNRNRKLYGRDNHRGSASGGLNGSASPSSAPPQRRASAARAAECDNRRFQQNHYSANGSVNGGASASGARNSSDKPANNNDSARNSSAHDAGNNGVGGDSGNSSRQEQRYNYERNNKYDRYERPIDRNERNGRNQRDRERERDYHHQRDNYRSNKRRDDWNRNRDRANGYRLEEKYSSDNGKDSPLPSPEKKTSPRKSKNYAEENEKLSQREKLIRDIETRRLECLVCVEPIKSHHAVWSCNNCYHILHLQCITKWASSSKSEDGWRCPACQNVNKEIPRDYYCFCGKVKNPQFNRQDTAHTCGEVCGRVEGCPHACTLLCHPGPCPPCQANVTRNCGCGKTTKTLQCCLKETITCDATCEKLLNCETHTCAAKCHEGKCEPCSEKVEQVCHCSKQERQVTCTRETHDKKTYSCGKPCGKELTCRNHKCKDCCHAGECRPCKLSPEVVTSCHCGKLPLLPEQRTSCLDPIPVCEGVCGKTLRCGKATNPHHCTAKCHAGNCPPCNKQTAVKCRCGHMDQMIKCRQLSTRADDARCKKRCVKKRSCGKHKCNQECCIDIDHICPMPCNHTLSCGKHKCDQQCHRGNCPPCYRSSFEELYCECGAEVIYPPVACGTKRPVCKRPCSRSHPCDHQPQHTCHSGPTCPPCMIFTTKYCFGKHEQRKTIPCSQESFCCGMACNKPLSCGRHKCIKVCHEGACQAPGEVCKQNCTTPRAACGHKCMAPCHEGDCPDTPCKEMVEVQCECGNRKQMRSCNEVAREYSRIATAQLASSMAEMQRGNYMELSEILAPVKINKTNKTLDCNEDCRLVERNRRLAIGLQIRNPDTSQKLLTKYSDFIRNFAKRDPALVKSIYDALSNLVKLAKESKQKSRSHSFPVMNREKRQLVHELCEMFGVDSVAYDAEPNRNVVATAHKDRSWLPATSIMEIMQREAGQRRVPVPTNNPWNIKR